VSKLSWVAATLLAVASVLPISGARAQGAAPAGPAPADDRGLTPTPRRSEGIEVLGATGSPAAMGSDEASAGGLFSLRERQGSLSGPVDPETYRLGPGDVLLLQIWGKVSRSIPLEVGPEGSVLVPGAAIVRVAGRTLSDVRADVLRRMSEQYRGVNMDLRLARPRTFLAYLTGQVRRPGPIEASGSLRVGDVLTAGMLVEGASRRRIDIMHTDGTRETCDLELFLQSGDGSLNPWLRDGDVIHVPAATEFVYAQGAVPRPGRYELGERDSLRTLLHLAGDPLPAAVMDRVLIVRFRDPVSPESLVVSLDQIYNRRRNLKLEDGEHVYVYFMPQYHVQHEAIIAGEVQRPGVYPIVEGRTRLSDLVSSANGFQPWADLTAIRVHRRSNISSERDPELERLLRLSRNDLTSTEYEVMRTKLAGQREDYRVDWRRMLGRKDLDLLMRDGDTVRVDRLPSSIRVDGEVQRPGILNFVAGQSVQDYVAQAGGYTARAWRGKVRVTRTVTGQTLLARNVSTLDPGDFVWVPEKPDVTAWEQSREVLTALAQVATVVIAIRSVR
jgi:protein involved in polysaccharide export with SLBB domain